MEVYQERIPIAVTDDDANLRFTFCSRTKALAWLL